MTSKTLLPTLVLFVCFSLWNSNAQCDADNDVIQNTSNSNLSFNSGNNQFGNSFAPTCSGKIESVSFWTREAPGTIGGISMTVELFRNPFGSNPVLLASVTREIPFGNGNREHTFIFDDEPDVVSGTSYGFRVTRNDTQFAVKILINSSDPYSGGRLFTNNFNSNSTTRDWDLRFGVNYLDEVAPIARCRNITRSLGVNGTVTISPNNVNNNSTDADSGVASFSLSQSNFDCDDIGENTVTLTVRDNNGNTDSCQAIVTITDGQGPLLTCPEDITVSIDPGEPSPIINYNPPTYSDCSPIGDVPDGFTYLTSRNDKFYYVSNAFERCDIAFAQAEALGGRVATIIDDDLNNVIRAGVDAIHGDENVLIGYNDVNTEGTFVWHDGNTDVTYENWASNQPNPSGNSLDYTLMLDTGLWFTANFTIRRPYILQLTGPTTIPTTGLASGSAFPDGTTTITYNVSDIFGNSSTCSFDVTVNRNPFETSVVLDADGKLTITDIENDSDDQITLSSDGTTLTISNLVLATASGNGVVQTDVATVTVPIANITNGIEFAAGNGNDSINFSTDLTLTGSDNDITLSGLGLGTFILDGASFQNGGHLNIGGDFIISNSPDAKIVIGELTAVNLNISDAFSVEEPNSALPITISGQTDIAVDSAIQLTGDTTRTFSGTVNLEAASVNFWATGSLNLGTVTTTSTLGILVNSVTTVSGDLTLTGNIVTAGDSDFRLRGDTINQSAGTITTDRLLFDGSDNGETTAQLFGDNDINILEMQTGRSLELIVFNDIDDIEIGRGTFNAMTLIAPTINLTENTDIVKNSTGVLSLAGNVNASSTSANSAASIQHNGGTIDFSGTTATIQRLKYVGVSGTSTRFLSNTTFAPDDINLLSLEFGKVEVEGLFDLGTSGISISVLDEMTIENSASTFSGNGTITGGLTTVNNSATITPGNDTQGQILTTSNITIGGGTFPATFAPYINGDTNFDQLNVNGTVTLSNPIFMPLGSFTVDTGVERLTLINNDGIDDAVNGTFDGLPEGSEVTLYGTSDTFIISYMGGDGNDVTLTRDTQAPVISCPADVTIDCADQASVFVTGVSTDTPIDIPDNDNTGITSIANVSGIDANLQVANITIQTAINHSWTGDLTVVLVAPGGESATLFAQSLQEASNLNANFPITFTDAATTPANDIGETISGNEAACEADNICEYTAMSGVDAFSQLIAEINANGSGFNGDWSLIVRDLANNDLGNLVSWQVNIKAIDPNVNSGTINTNPDATGTATATDNCNTPVCDVTVAYEDSVVDGCGVSEVITRTWTATDSAGNASSCVQTITVTDTASPILDSCPEDIIFSLPPGDTDAIITYELPTATDVCGDVTIIQTDGLASGDTFPEGVTTNTFSITDACGNETICSFTVTVAVPETLVEFTGGKLTITDVNGGVSDDDILISEDGLNITIENLIAPVEVLGDVTLVDETTVRVTYADITNGIEFVAGDGINAVTLSEIFIFTGETNNLKFDNLEDFTVIGFINTEGDIEITGNGNLDLNIGPWTAKNLVVDNALFIRDQSGPGITVSGTTNLMAANDIAIDDGQGFHEFNGPVTLEARNITFTAGADLTLNEVTITTDESINYFAASPGTLTLDGNINITEAGTNLFLESNDTITQQSGIINNGFLILRGDGSGTATLDGANTVGAFAVENPFNANASAFSNVSFTNAVNMFLADIIVDEFTLTAPEFDLEPDFTIITKNGSEESNFNANIDINTGTLPARVVFNHNGGTINFNGTVNDFDGLLDYNGNSAGTVNFSGTTTVNPDITPSFGSLNSTGTFIAKRGVIGVSNEARFSGSSSVLKGEAFLSGPTIVENGATITPGNINDVSLLVFSDLTMSSATYAPVIKGNDEYDSLEVLGQGTVNLNNANLTPIGGYTIQPGDEIVIIDNNGPNAVSGIFNNLPEYAGVVFGDFVGMISYVGGDEGKDVVLVPDTIDPVAVCQDLILSVGVNDITVTGNQLDGGSTDNGTISEFLINGQSSIDYTLADIGDIDVTLTVVDASGNSADCTATITLVQEVLLRPKVYLQGASLNPNLGEDTLMRDDLRANGLLPTTSPYVDGLTTTFLTVEPNNNVVDWIWVELRDKTDNTLVIDGQSALLQRDGDVVNTNSNGSLTFTVPADDYYVVIKHRNHLGIMTANPVALSSTSTNINFTDANSPITFGADAQTTIGMPNGILGMWAGDTDGDGILSFANDGNSILFEVLFDPGNTSFSSLYTGANDYYNGDMDLNTNLSFQDDLNNVLFNILFHPSNSSFSSLFAFAEQLPVSSTSWTVAINNNILERRAYIERTLAELQELVDNNN